MAEEGPADWLRRVLGTWEKKIKGGGPAKKNREVASLWGRKKGKVLICKERWGKTKQETTKKFKRIKRKKTGQIEMIKDITRDEDLLDQDIRKHDDWAMMGGGKNNRVNASSFDLSSVCNKGGKGGREERRSDSLIFLATRSFPYSPASSHLMERWQEINSPCA